MSVFEAHGIYSLAWLSFGLAHSLLASVKARDVFVPTLGAYYRLTYNLVALVHIVVVLVVGVWVFDDTARFVHSNWLDLSQSVLWILGLIILILALRSYDLGRLAGTNQIRNYRCGISEPEDEPLQLKGLHAYVRHPLYTGAHLLLWGAAQDNLSLATAIWGSGYLLIGTYFEERKLLTLYGERYESYRSKVPALLPWRGRAD
jgi:methanethiol S-methyltransferase